jgi:hypothetical protein
MVKLDSHWMTGYVMNLDQNMPTIVSRTLLPTVTGSSGIAGSNVLRYVPRETYAVGYLLRPSLFLTA